MSKVKVPASSSVEREGAGSSFPSGKHSRPGTSRNLCHLLPGPVCTQSREGLGLPPVNLRGLSVQH